MAEQGSNSRFSLSSVLQVLVVISVLGGLVVVADRVGGASGDGITGAAITWLSCTDTDGDKDDADKAGFVTFSYRSTSGRVISATVPDACLSDNFVREYYCDGNQRRYTDLSCSNGCSNGKCDTPIPVCRNGVLEDPEQCDDGNMIDNDACTNACTTPRCGDSVVLSDEQCDDGNTVGGDGCSNTCVLEPTEPTPKGSSCKIISQVSSDYQWIWDEKPTASKVCAKEDLVCAGVFKKTWNTYFDDNEPHKQQMTEPEDYWLSPYYCNEIMGDTTYFVRDDNSPEIYAEPYAGPVKKHEMISAVLCCS